MMSVDPGWTLQLVRHIDNVFACSTRTLTTLVWLMAATP